MSSQVPRTGAARDVPRPRPVDPTGGPADDVDDAGGGPLGRAARLLADAVAGLLADRQEASDDDRAGAEGSARGGRRTARILRDVVGAVAAAAARGAEKDGAANDGAGTDGAAHAGAANDPASGGPRDKRGWHPGEVLSDLLRTAAPRLPIRDRARLLAAHPDRVDAEIADQLVRRAARLTAGIGVATGGLTAAQWFAPPSMIALPLELGAETVLVAAVEVVLIGELHELYGRPATGEPGARAGAYLDAWTHQRALTTTEGGGGLLATLGTAGINALRRRVTRRLARNASSAAPLLLGATLAARSNRKATGQLAEKILAGLRVAQPGPGAH